MNRAPSRLGHAMKNLAILLLAAALSGDVVEAPEAGAQHRRPAPLEALQPAGEILLASWYGPGFHGRPMASGAPYDQDALTCASPSLPLGARVRVAPLLGGPTLTLTVTDRGPYVPGRTLDVSREAARRLAFQRQGLAALRVEVETWP
ncbi:MAG: septal ring lytic transglycosylase RlpA family protein [Acidobacteriota bacterium]